MRPRVAIIAALDRELRPLVKGWDVERSENGVTVYSTETAVAVCGGMGRQRAEIATKTALGLGPVSQIISAGWAGALHGGMPVTTVQFVDAVIDVRTGERFALQDGEPEGSDAGETVLVTMDRVASAAEKNGLGKAFAADLVDMEAAAVARISRAHRIPFLAIKAVSDGPEFDLPGMEEFTTSTGQVREGTFAAYVALRPALWGQVFSLARNSAVGARRLALELEQYLRWDEKRASGYDKA